MADDSEQTPPSAADKARITANIQKMQAGGASDAEIEQYLTGVEHLAPQHLTPKYSPKAIASINKAEQANAADEDASQPGYGERLATHVLNAAHGIPGVEAVEAGAGALGSRATNNPMNYSQALAALRSSTGNIGAGTSFAEKALGSLATAPLAAATGGSPTLTGGIYGALSGALKADPESLAQRGAETAGRGVLGGALGLAGSGLFAGGSALASKAASMDGRLANALRSGLSRATPTAPAPDPLRALQGMDILPAEASTPAAAVPAAVTQQQATQQAQGPALAQAVAKAQTPQTTIGEQLAQALAQALAKARQAAPAHEVPSIFSDADIAQGLDKPQPNLEDLLRQSLLRRGVTPIIPQ